MITPRETQRIENVAHHYDELDPVYREVWGEHVHHGYWESGSESSEAAVEAIIHLIAAKAILLDGQKVVDIGCGYGATSRFLEDEYGAKVTGLTVSKAQYEYALNTYPNGPKVLLQDWLNNELPDNSFDVAIAVESIGHMENKRRFFEQAMRVLKPGGRLVICAWLSAQKSRAWEKKYLLEPIVREGRFPSMGNQDDYARLMGEAGFSNIQFENISKNVKKTWSQVIYNFLKKLGSNSHARQVLLNPTKRDRIFAKTIFRIWTAYQTGSMQYGLFYGKKALSN